MPDSESKKADSPSFERAIALSRPIELERPVHSSRDLHQIDVALSGRSSALVDGPDDQALATPHVAGRKHSWDIRVKVAIFGFGVGAGIFFHAELFEKLALRPAEAQREQN